MLCLGSVGDFLMGALLAYDNPFTFIYPDLANYGMGGIHLSVAITILYFSNLLRLKINNNRGTEVIKFFKDAGLVLITLEILGEIAILILAGVLYELLSIRIGGLVITLLADFSLLIMTAVGFYGIVKVNINLVTIYINLKVIASFLIISVFVVVLAVYRVTNLILDVLLYVPIILYGLDFFVLHLNVMIMTRSANIKQTSDLRPSPPSV